MFSERRGVKIVHGANDGEFDLSGHPVASLRTSLVDAFNIPADAIAFVNGRRVTPDYIAQAQDVIEFVRERGEKGGRKRSQGIPDEDDEDGTHPDLSAMSLDGLAVFIDGRLASSHEAEQRSLLQAHKSAVALFWAGAALFEARAKCEQQGRGAWKTFKEEHGFKHTTANDAIRLFENAKTPDALAGLGVTEAKQKFVYPEPKPPAPKPRVGTTKQTTASKRTPPATPTAKDNRPEVFEASTDVEPEVDEPEDVDDEVVVLDPADAIAEELEGIAQRLNEIAQDDLGKVALTEQLPIRLDNAIRAIAQSVTNICRRIDHDRRSS